MREFVYDFFVLKTGLRVMAEVHLSALFLGVKEHLGTSKRVEMFGSLVGHSACPVWPTGAERVFLSILSRVFAGIDGPPESESSDGRSDVPVESLKRAAAEALPEISWENLDASLIMATGGGNSADLDDAMHALMSLWLQRKAQDADRAEELFRRHDANKDGLLNFAEFSSLVEEVEGPNGVADGRVETLFRLFVAQQSDESNEQIAAPIFRLIAWDIGLGGGTSSSKVANPVDLPKRLDFRDGLILRDLLPELQRSVESVCLGLKGIKSVEQELDHMQKLFKLISETVTSNSNSISEVWLPYRRFLLLLHISSSRQMVLAQESKAELGASAFSTTLKEGFDTPR
uniref:EF-hand domain-containing protein n=1 Tax=Tetraselmis sp. GSL018 TaxID=582737 RepID=A0A061RE57_9CHLO